ncbi:MAG: hypothetical protein MEQ07_06910 [Aquimonas sp.]|nr:hypothetical protein [Aquimonas sp.]
MYRRLRALLPSLLLLTVPLALSWMVHASAGAIAGAAIADSEAAASPEALPPDPPAAVALDVAVGVPAAERKESTEEPAHPEPKSASRTSGSTLAQQPDRHAQEHTERQRCLTC